MSEEKETESLRIVKFAAQNFLRLRAVEITPDGDMVTIGGKNKAGKTSILWAIESALGGGKVLPDDPIRHGARKARIVVDLGTLVVERLFTSKGSSLVVRGKDGMPIASPQAVLNELFSKVSWDPLAFTRMAPKDQDTILKQAIGLDLSELDGDHAKLYAARTEHNREAKRLEAQVDAMQDLGGVPDEEVSVAALVEEIGRRQTIASDNGRQRERLQVMGEKIRAMEHGVEALNREIAALEEKLEAKRAEYAEAREKTQAEYNAAAELEKQIEGLEDPDVDELHKQIATAEETNRKVRAKRERKDLETQLARAQNQSQACTDAMEAIAEKKAERLAAAEFPVEGLGFDESGPTLNGVPLEQASQAEKLRLSVAIGAALNPRLKVLLVRDGSLLDEDGLRLLAEHAKATGCQVWLERVSSTGEGCSVLIEDGEIADSAESAAE